MQSKLVFIEDGHKYFYNDVRIPCVSDILREGGFSTDFSKVKEDVLNKATFRGTAIHRTTQFYDKGTLAESKLSSGLVPMLTGWKKFLGDYDLSFEPHEIEQPLYSRIWHFAGTPDRFLTERGILVDLKSGIMTATSKLQVAAYRILVEENYGIKIKIIYVVHLIENDYKISKYTPAQDTKDVRVFLGTVQGYHWKAANGLLKKKLN